MKRGIGIAVTKVRVSSIHKLSVVFMYELRGASAPKDS